MQSTSTTCKTTYFTSFDAIMNGNNVQLRIVTSFPVNFRYFCLQCPTNDAALPYAYSKPFPMEVKACYQYVAVSSPVGTF